jgi:hypothetical protein
MWPFCFTSAETKRRSEFDVICQEQIRTPECSDGGPSGKAARVSAMDGANILATSTHKQKGHPRGGLFVLCMGHKQING